MPQYISGGWMEVKTLNVLKPQWYMHIVKFSNFNKILDTGNGNKKQRMIILKIIQLDSTAFRFYKNKYM